MPKRFAEPTDKNKGKTALVVIIISVVVVVLGVAAVFMFNSGIGIFGKNSDSDTQPTQEQSNATENIDATTDTLSMDELTETTSANTNSTVADTTAESTQPQESTSQNIVVPDAENADNTALFNATFLPYKAIDTYTDSECSLKEVFGSSFSAGTVTFNSDGTFTDTLIFSSSNSGAYSVSNEKITATYSNDKNMIIDVIQWSEGTPSEFIINYGGYDVYFN
ncbi:MAG: hypothetical protein U0L20_04160 [Ruminococcus sp.]|nr:hypothetical protein [Ruminococcus sp.]